MQRAWACACALPADSNAPQAPALLDLDHAELLCSDTKNLWPAQCDKRWFCDEFCDGRGLDRELAESVWDLVAMRAPVETVALMACVSGLVEEFYRPEAACESNAAQTNNAKLIGARATIASSQKLSEFLLPALRKGVSLNNTLALE